MTADVSPWKRHGTRLFRYFPNASTWFEARSHCINAGAHLASIHSKQEDEFIQSKVALLPDHSSYRRGLWIGLSDNRTEGNWSWDDGSLLDFTNWGVLKPVHGSVHGTEPNGGTTENCGQMGNSTTYTSSDLLWNDAPCDTKIGYICAKSGFSDQHSRESQG